MTTTVRKPLKFYSATAVKRICLDNGFVEANAPMFVAKWEGLYVIAQDAEHYFVVSETQAPEYVRTDRDEKGKLKVASNAPVIYPEGFRFQWTVECGRTCPDSCDETVTFIRIVNNKAEAEALVAELDGTRYRSRQNFLRIRGPAFYQIKRPTPRPAPVAVPNTGPTQDSDGIPVGQLFFEEAESLRDRVVMGRLMPANREPRSGMLRPGPHGRGSGISEGAVYDDTPFAQTTRQLFWQVREHQRYLASYRNNATTNSRTETPEVVEVSTDSTNPNTSSSFNTR